MNLNTILKKVLAGAAAALALASVPAQAVLYSFDATDVAAFGAGPYGTVLLAANGSNVDFTIGLRSDLNFVNTGGPHSVFSFNALNVAVGDISNIKFNGVAAASGFTVVAPGANQPFGTFTLAIDCTGGSCQNGAPGQTVDPLTFTVANAALTDFGFTTATSSAFFASDVICVTGNCNGATGAIGVTGTNKVPEPNVLALLGLGLIGFGLSRRRSKN